MNNLEKLNSIIAELANEVGFDKSIIWVGVNSYGEYETEYSKKLFSNCLTYDEAESEIRTLVRGIQLGMSLKS